MNSEAPAVVHLLGYLRPGGGPSGYLYNLREACRTEPDCPIGFATRQVQHERDPHTVAIGPPRWARALVGVLPDWALRRWARASARSDAARVLDDDLASQLASADAVVVHDWLMFHHYLNWRDRSGHATQIAILMDHSPRSPNALIGDDWALRWRRPDKARLISEQWEAFVLDAFARADAILVPNREALDDFYPGEERKRQIILAKPIVELPSGVPALRPKRRREEVRRALGLTEDALVVGYLGRHALEKGYDVFVEAARQATADPLLSRLRFVSAGEGPLKAEAARGNLTELGWRQDAAELMNALDVLLAPNRFAYFDLVILEAMSLGKTVYTTFVGGSKALAPGSVKYLAQGSPAAVAREFLSLVAGDQPLLDPARVRKIFAANYSEEVFLQRHLEFAGDIRRQPAG